MDFIELKRIILMAFLKKLFALITNKIFLKNILGMFLAIFLIIYCILWILKFYTNHGATYPISDLIEMDVDAAQKVAQDAGFILVISDSIYLEGKKNNIVLQQNPKAGKMVKKDRNIYVTTTKSIPDLVTLPSMADGNDNFDLYSKKLNALGVHSKIKSKISNFKYAKNTIVEVWDGEHKIAFSNLKKGYKIPKGSTLSCVITKTSVDYIDVPDITCRTINEATFILNSYGLKLGNINKEGITNENVAFIAQQTPVASTVDKIAVGGKINITLSASKPVDCQ